MRDSPSKISPKKAKVFKENSPDKPKSAFKASHTTPKKSLLPYLPDR
jgi:hypothetical protein